MRSRSGTPDTLAAYRSRRDFTVTAEPDAQHEPDAGNRFVIQKHDARRLHYDLRLEMDGVLKSWAVTRGPSLVPGLKRLSIHTEDHPIRYLEFEGVIPAGQYGGGTMIVWDRGRWIPDGDPHADYARGRLTFTLEGERLAGRWHLVRTRGRAGRAKEEWLLIKADDEAARAADEPDILEEETRSLKSGRTIEEIAAQGEIRIDHAQRAVVARSGAVECAAETAQDVARIVADDRFQLHDVTPSRSGALTAQRGRSGRAALPWSCTRQ